MNDTVTTTLTCSYCWGPTIKLAGRAYEAPACRRCSALIQEAYEVNAGR